MQVRVLHLVKDGHSYVFRYGPGQEDRIVDEIVALVEEGETNLDWMDAANLSYQVVQHAAEECSHKFRTQLPGAKDGPCPRCP